MFIILTYDVNQKRDTKMLKICRKYLVHIQRSVFEGNITEKNLGELKNEIDKIIKYNEDSVCIYSMVSLPNMRKEQIGVFVENSNIIV